MEYTVENFTTLLMDAEIPITEVAKVTAAWGEGEEYFWIGGFCLTMHDGECIMVIQNEKGIPQVFYSDTWDTPFSPPTEDYDEQPDQIKRWYDDGCPEEIWEY